MPITQFGTYDFTRAFIRAGARNSNFGQKVNGVQRLPYMNGGVRTTGRSPSVHEIGSVQARFTLVAQSRDAMQALRDEINSLQRVGLADLTFQPSDPALPVRTCAAEIINISLPERDDRHSDLFQPVSIAWQVPYPRWLVGRRIANPIVQAVSGTSTDITVDVAGNAPSRLKLVLAIGNNQLAATPIIERRIGTRVVDRVSSSATLGQFQSLEVDGIQGIVTRNGFAEYDEVSILHPRLLVADPGDNTIRVRLGNSSDAGTVTISYYDEFYGA